jgi:hypothetical protein
MSNDVLETVRAVFADVPEPDTAATRAALANARMGARRTGPFRQFHNRSASGGGRWLVVGIAAVTVVTLCILAIAAPWHSGLGSTPSASAALELGRVFGQNQVGPYVGVDCPAQLNSFKCDRLGVAVQLVRPAASLHVALAGRSIEMRIPTGVHAGHGYGSRGQFFEGFLQPAGLINGSLRITPDGPGQYWVGKHPRFIELRIAARYSDGTISRTTFKARVMPGWG